MALFFALSAFLLAIVVGLAIGVFVVLPLLLACWETLRSNHGDDDNDSPKFPSSRRFVTSKLCVGQVWHTRFHPKRHSFTYPIFMFALDLEESFGTFLWPMVRFQPHVHHLKNGEGKRIIREANASTTTTTTNEGTASMAADKEASSSSSSSLHLAERILNLVAIKTKNKFQPTLKTHKIILLTHLEYFGYNFNPVSFYYVANKATKTLEAMVGEVSNTPWTEMYCYVLHPESVDQVQCDQKEVVPVIVGSTTDKENTTVQHDYRFPKAFHVSPFMEMEYWYDWTFQGIPGSENEFVVKNSLRRRSTEETMDFTATLRLSARPLTPFAVAWQMIRFPIFCLLIQIWIHYQAAWLFIKGVVYVPHPQGSETAASKTIATLMTPFFAIRDYCVEAKTTTTKTTSTKED